MTGTDAPSTEPGPAAAPDVAIIIPTYQEEGNVARLAARLSGVLAHVNHEIIFVDDHSPDGTADRVRDLSRKDPRIRIIERIHRRGLATAVIEGLLSTSAPFGVVIDGDLQHDEAVIPALVKALADGADVAVGSRYVDGGGTAGWSARRRTLSCLATRLSRLVPAARISDPMSGFFAVRTDVFRQRAGQLVGAGYKILLDLLSTSGPEMRIEEVAYVFRDRAAGASKLDLRVALAFGKLILARTLGRFLPVRLITFLLAGAAGAAVYLYGSTHASWSLAALAGMVTGAGWNHVSTVLFTRRS